MDVKKKATELVKSCGVFMMATVDGSNCPQMRPMSGKVVQDNLVILMPTYSGSRKIHQLQKNQQCQLVFTAQDFSSWTSLTGKASLMTDQKKTHQLFEEFNKQSPEFGKHFKGSDDPNYGVVEFSTKLIEFNDFSSHQPYVLEL
ncbi:MAG: pyridoxamine 5'-phosphate oxidase family protein [Candidatus Riflebacteria bacterium]|nr:pyridoxamine 5'-phosphate oxidase family protein [Candidatus Riflebacteria bacterium]